MSTPPQELRGSASRGPAGTSGRVLPHDLDAEQAVLGCLLIDGEAILKVRDILDPADFYAERNGQVFRAALALSDRGEPVDVLTLKVQLERDETLSRSGGIEYLAELSQKMPTAASVRHYAQIVVDHSLRRRLIAAAGEMAQLGFDAGQRTEDILDTAERRIFSIADLRRSLEISHIAQMLTETWELMERRAQSRQIVHGVPTNYSRLDAVTQGLQPGELIVLAARPAVGKTSFALNIARNAAVLANRRVVIFSLEMSKQALVQRLICSEAKVDAYLISTGQADAHAFERIAGAMDRLSQANIWIDDTPALPISELRARARRMKAQQSVDLVVVDYLQLMRGGRQDSRVQEVSEISSGLKTIAKELSIPVLALSQLSREFERRENRKPQLSDLRDSGCLTGESLVWLPDQSRPVPIRDLAGRRDFEVLALNPETWQMERRRALRAFHSGVKPVFRLTLRSGRTIRASANHRFLTAEGWRRLDELTPGIRLATPRWLPSGERATMTDDELALLGHLIGDGCTLPRHAIQYTTKDRELAELVAGLATRVFGSAVTPRISPERSWYQVYLPSAEPLTHGRRNPVAAWLDELGVFGLRSYERRVPDAVFGQTMSGIGVFLRHLWATDGCIHMSEVVSSCPHAVLRDQQPAARPRRAHAAASVGNHRPSPSSAADTGRPRSIPRHPLGRRRPHPLRRPDRRSAARIRGPSRPRYRRNLRRQAQCVSRHHPKLCVAAPGRARDEAFRAQAPRRSGRTRDAVPGAELLRARPEPRAGSEGGRCGEERGAPASVGERRILGRSLGDHSRGE